MEVQVYNTQGERIYHNEWNDLSEGEHLLNIAPENLKPGIYLISVNINGEKTFKANVIK